MHINHFKALPLFEKIKNLNEITDTYAFNHIEKIAHREPMATISSKKYKKT